MLIFDTESDDLVDGATKIHIFSWTKNGEDFFSTDDPNEFSKMLSEEPLAGCHNAIRHDFPLMEKLYGYTYKGLRVDTLFLSWYLYPKEIKHGLEEWGLKLGFPKVEIGKEEWKNLGWEKAKERCERDVKINWLLWKKMESDLEGLYGGNGNE